MINWAIAIQQKRQQWVQRLGQARKQGNDHVEQAMTTLMTQIGEFEEVYHNLQQTGKTEAEIVAQLSSVIRKQWPELWATMASGFSSGTPEAWVANPYVVVGSIVEHVSSDTTNQVCFESRINQLETLPLSQKAETLLESMIDQSWERLKSYIEQARNTMEDWEYAAFMHQVSKYFLAAYGKAQVNAIAAIKKAEESGQLIEISIQDT